VITQLAEFCILSRYIVTESYYDERSDFKVLKAFKNIEDAEDFVRKLNEPPDDLSLITNNGIN
jgi:hypothetical protein